MQYTAEIIAVGKYKEQFKSTGVLINTGSGDFWVDIQGQLDWKRYKGNKYTFDISQNDKGYWGGTIVGDTPAPTQQPQQQAPPPQQRPPQQNIQDNIAFGQAYNLANADYVANKIEEGTIQARTRLHYNVLKTRQFPAQMCEYTPPPQQAPPQQSQEGYNQTAVDPDTGQDIPF